jgi:uncharacterized protein YhaN
MRFDRIDLTRFGVFTDCRLDLSAPGLQLVVGRNEAGKTTAMDAIRQLLFGIPMRSRHAFLHDMPNLAIGASVVGEDGSALEIVRVKKRSGTLRDPDGNPIDEALLARLLHDVSEDVYSSLFTIGHDEIVAGGEALLSSEGEVGRALFSASRGTTDLAAVMRRLDDRAAELFKGSASKPLLNASIREYKDATFAVKQLSRSASKVLELDKKLAAAREDHDRVAAQRKTLAQRLSLLSQVKTARPQLALRDDARRAMRELEAAGPLVDLALDEQLASAREQRKQGEADRQSAQAAIDRLNRQLTGLSIDTALLEQATAIEQLQTASGGYEQNQEDLPGLRGRAEQRETELEDLRRRLSAEVPLDEQGRARLTVDQEANISQLTEARTKLDSRLEHAVDDQEEADAELASRLRALATRDEPADVSALVEISARIRKAGDLEQTRTDAARRLSDLEAEVVARLADLGLSGVEPRTVDAQIVPSLGSIKRLREQDADRIKAIAGEALEIKKLEAKQAETGQELDELLRTDQPPTAADLEASRTHRDTGWRLVRGAWLGGAVDDVDADSWSDGKPLPDAYEGAVEGADAVADRLRREANAVEQRATLEKQLEGLVAELELKRASLSEAQAARDAADRDWAELWAPLGVTPESRSAMEDWRDRFREGSERSVEARRIQGELDDLDATIARHRSDLIASLTATGVVPAESLSLLGLLDHAERVVADASEAAQGHAADTRSCKETEALVLRRGAALGQAQEELQSWKASWREAITAIGLTESASPAEARAVLETLSKIFTSEADFQKLRSRVDGIEGRNTEFTNGFAAVRAALQGHDDVADADPGAAVRVLVRRLKDAQAASAKAEGLATELESNEADLVEAKQLVAEAERLIAGLVEGAGVVDEPALFEALVRSKASADHAAEIDKAERDLRASIGKTMEQIEADAAGYADVELEPEIEEVERQLEDVDEELRDEATAFGELKHERSQIEASGDAADQMTLAQQSLASVVDHADEYVQTVLARHLLEEQVNSYRDEHQGPLLERARVLFRELTLEAYIGLDTDTNDKGEPFLQARKADERLLEISALSTGTRDQLYLALRLAALEQFMERRGPLPLVLDDLFVHFDDGRTRAGLKVLDQLARSTQVLLFTHHQEVAEQAADVIADGRLTLHDLG